MIYSSTFVLSRFYGPFLPCPGFFSQDLYSPNLYGLKIFKFQDCTVNICTVQVCTVQVLTFQIFTGTHHNQCWCRVS